jgi:hypothetical protein
VVTHDRSIGSWIFYFGGDSFISFYWEKLNLCMNLKY